jgi:hypothetical protein
MRRLIVAILLGMLLLPSVSYGAESTFFGPIVPKECHSCPCGFAGVLEIMRHLMNFAVTLGVIVLTVVIAWAGLMYILSAANPESRSKANGLITGAIIGMVLVLSSWLIVDFVMRTLYSGEAGNAGKFGPWNSILAEKASWCIKPDPDGGQALFDSLPFTPGQGPVVNPTDPDPNPNQPGEVSPGSYTHAQAKSKLASAGIPISSSGNCSDRTNRTCTSLDGMRQDTISQAITVKSACNCSVVVTGGTEVGHEGGTQSHSTGYKIDLGAGGSLDTYLKTLTRAGSRGNDPTYVDKCGNEYVRESDHWDITVNRGVCNPPR